MLFMFIQVVYYLLKYSGNFDWGVNGKTIWFAQTENF